jgi:MFS family permease
MLLLSVRKDNSELLNVIIPDVTVPLGGLSDMYRRKRLVVIAILIFLAGSALSGMAHSIDELIAFRAVQGLGAGGLMVGAIATLGDLVPPCERGQYMSDARSRWPAPRSCG